jgi:predicted transcriptional regulator
MTSVHRIQVALSSGEKLQGSAVAAKAGISRRRFYRDITKLHEDGHVSREKPTGGAGYYRYFLNDLQMEAFRSRLARYSGALVADTAVISERLKFLRMLKEKTVFSDHATLALIIEDYERTLKLRRACEQRAESEESRGRPRKADHRERIAA